MKIKLIILVFFVSAISIFSQDFPKVMYVYGINSLNQWSSPQLSSDGVGTLLYGERIVVYERGNNVTIDGITDYWYRTERRIDGSNMGGFSWVFGGYLSAEMPLDVEPVLGYWDTDVDSRDFWLFTPYNNIFSSARKGSSDLGFYGNWILSGNKLILNIIPVETTSYSGERTIIIEITVVNRDNILFTYEDGRVEKLTRSNNLDRN
jgi:hypothetical protein